MEVTLNTLLQSSYMNNFRGKARFENVSLVTFQGFEDTGSLNLTVVSLTRLPAEFIISFNCSQQISPIPSRTISLPGLGSSQYSFPVYTTSHNATTSECMLSLLSSSASLLDSFTLTFNTSSPNYTTPQLGPFSASATSFYSESAGSSKNSTFSLFSGSTPCLFLCSGLSLGLDPGNLQMLYLLSFLLFCGCCCFLQFRCGGGKLLRWLCCGPKRGAKKRYSKGVRGGRYAPRKHSSPSDSPSDCSHSSGSDSRENKHKNRNKSKRNHEELKRDKKKEENNRRKKKRSRRGEEQSIVILRSQAPKSRKQMFINFEEPSLDLFPLQDTFSSKVSIINDEYKLAGNVTLWKFWKDMGYEISEFDDWIKEGIEIGIVSISSSPKYSTSILLI